METIFDWVSVGIFAILVTHFLQQSADRSARPTPMWKYLVAAAGCALADWLGNQGQGAAAAAVIAMTIAFMAYVYFAPSGPREDH